MGLTQMSALTGGRKFKRPYVEEINAQTKYLPAIYGQKKEDAYRDKMHGLETQRLALSEEALDTQKKSQKRANKLGYANMGLAGAFGAVDAYPGLKEMGGDVADWLNPTEAVGFDSLSSGKDYFGGTQPMQDFAAAPIDWMSDAYTDYLSPAIKNLGSGIWDAGKGIFDSIVGDSIDFDWSDAFI